MTDLERDILDNRLGIYGTARRELARFFRGNPDFKQAYANLLDAGYIHEQGTGKRGDPCIVVSGRKPEDYSNMMPWVVSIPRSAWVEFTTNCVIHNREPEQVLLELLSRAIEAPSISQSDKQNA